MVLTGFRVNEGREIRIWGQIWCDAVFDVPKIELRRFSAFPCNKKMVLTGFRVNEGRESEYEVRFGVTPFFDVPRIEHRRFSAFPCNKKLGLASCWVKWRTRNLNLRSYLVWRRFLMFSKGKTGSKGHYIRTKLALRASKSKLTGRASTLGQNWSEGPVSQG